jgi:magnesium-transporting ATPase (P-type)
MNIYWFIIIFSAWYILALVVSEKIGKKRKIGEEWSFFLSIMLSPVIGLLISILFKKSNN